MNLLKKTLKKIPILTNGVKRYKKYKTKALYSQISNLLELPERPPKKVLIYPDELTPWNAIASILNILNFEITYDIDDNYLFAIKWHDTTFKNVDEAIREVSKLVPVLNIASTDISKARVDQLCQEIFGYSTIINPMTYQGKCVQKSNINSLHDGRIVTSPVAKPKGDYIYQILIDNRVHNNYVEDIRVPFYKDHIPFVYLKYKLVEHQFASKTKKVILKKPDEVFSNDEIEKIVQLALKMKLDFAEMDVLRHRLDNRIYVIDVNDTPGGLPKSPRGTDILNRAQKKEALSKMALSFYNSFLRDLN